MRANAATPFSSLPFRADQRGNIRYRVECPAIIRFRGTAGVYLVTILDVSIGGLRVDCSKYFPVGTSVELCFANVKVPGEVRYSREVSFGQFHLGIQLAEGHEDEVLRRLGITTAPKAVPPPASFRATHLAS